LTLSNWSAQPWYIAVGETSDGPKWLEISKSGGAEPGRLILDVEDYGTYLLPLRDADGVIGCSVRATLGASSTAGAVLDLDLVPTTGGEPDGIYVLSQEVIISAAAFARPTIAPPQTPEYKAARQVHQLEDEETRELQGGPTPSTTLEFKTEAPKPTPGPPRAEHKQ
jgi:hypothetical protein